MQRCREGSFAERLGEDQPVTLLNGFGESLFFVLFEWEGKASKVGTHQLLLHLLGPAVARDFHPALAPAERVEKLWVAHLKTRNLP